jgi:hypothetical protein
MMGSSDPGAEPGCSSVRDAMWRRLLRLTSTRDVVSALQGDGIIPRIINSVFTAIEDSEDKLEFSVKVS